MDWFNPRSTHFEKVGPFKHLIKFTKCSFGVKNPNRTGKNTDTKTVLYLVGSQSELIINGGEVKLCQLTVLINQRLAKHQIDPANITDKYRDFI